MRLEKIKVPNAGSLLGKIYDARGQCVALTWGKDEATLDAWYAAFVESSHKLSVKAGMPTEFAEPTRPREDTPPPLCPNLPPEPSSFDEPTTPPNPSRRKGR